MLSLPRIVRMVRKELRQALRDRQMRSLIVVSPLIQLVVFGYAVSTDVRNVPLWVVDQDRTTAARELVQQLTASGYFTVAGRSDRPADGLVALETGQARVALEIPPGYQRDLTGAGATVQVLVDGTDPNTANIALGYLTRIVLRAGQDLVGSSPPVTLVPRAWYNPALESRTFNVPAIIGVLLFLGPMLLTALGVVRERELGTWDQLVVSPVGAMELMLGKTVPVMLIALLNLTMVWAMAMLWFGIPVTGNPLALLAGAVPFIGTAVAFGLLISTVSATQQEAFMSMFLVLLPALIFSGFLFPVESMPDGFQAVAFLNPVRHVLVIVRGVFLRGTSFADHAVQYAVLVTAATVGLSIAVRRFHAMVRG